MYNSFGKRLLDLMVVLPALIIISPVFLLIALLVRIRIGSPIFFRQQRPGLRGEPFTIYKFRTMADANNAQGELLPDSERLVSLGKFLRNTSLDELPELINVLKGEMSLVGPRPLLMQYLDRYTENQMRRHDVMPGITGWAQVNGRNAVSWEEKFEMDLWYLDNISLWLDMKIIIITIWKTLTCAGINQPGQATAREFKGTHRNYEK